MSMRGLVVALLCGVLGLGVGALVAYAAQPETTTSIVADPISAVSPSVPVDPAKSDAPYAPDISFPRLRPGLPLPVVHTISNDLASWSYHVPLGWTPYWVCSSPSECPPSAHDDKPMAPRLVDKVSEVRFRPPQEPSVGGYSLRVRVLENSVFDVHQTVGTKITGFRDSAQIADFNVLHRDDHSVYFEYRDAASNLHRYNYFQWFAVPGQTNATLEMSVSGRQRDVAGLQALFNRFADNVTGSPPSPKGPSGSSSPSGGPSADQSPSETPGTG
jgi:hypothetical protein